MTIQTAKGVSVWRFVLSATIIFVIELLAEIWKHWENLKAEGLRNRSSHTGSIIYCHEVASLFTCSETLWMDFFNVSSTSRWHLLTTQSECCSVSSSSAATSRDRKCLRSSKVSSLVLLHLSPVKLSITVTVCVTLIFTNNKGSHH